MQKKRIFFWGGGFALLVLIILWGYYLYNKPHRSAASEDAAVSIDAGELLRQYQQDEKRADSKYLGKTIEVKGKLVEVQHAGQADILILSGGAGNQGTSPSAGDGGVNCQLFGGEKPPSIKAGDLVTVKGRCTGFLADVNLVDCVIIQ